jgi:mono/diheme cytochrome c family protein
VLAVLAIILWHFYHVHLRHFNKAMLTGQMTREEMQHEHPAELALIEAGKATKDISPKVLQQRMRIFYPIASVIVVVSGFLLFQFVTFEKTAIDTVPPVVTGEAFVPYTPTPTLVPSPTPTITPTPTPGPARPTATPGAVVSGDTWDTTISAIFNNKCAACHINAALGDLSLKTYADAVKGGKSGAAIVAGDPDASVLIQIQQKGGHAGQLSADELATVIAWITAGAPETSGGAAAPVAAASEGWTGGIDQLITAKCAACHVNSALGELSLKTYADALKGGKSGAAIVPNDPVKSVLVTIQQKGGHAGQLSAEEIERVIAWINAGAPEAGGAAAPAPRAAAAGWTGGLDKLITAKCATCHVATKLGDLSLKTYADALKGGKSGPAIVPNDPLKSVLVVIQQKGGHAGQFTQAEIERFIAWIEAGAPETGGSTEPAPVATTASTATSTPAGPRTSTPTPTPTVEFVPTLPGGDE